MSSSDVETLRSAYEAFARQDMATVMGAFQEDIEWISPDSLPFGGTYRGHEAVAGFFGQLPEHWQELMVEPAEFIDGGETIVVAVRLRGTGAGGSMDTQALHRWRMRDGKAAAFREYSDTARALQALGLRVPANS